MLDGLALMAPLSLTALLWLQPAVRLGFMAVADAENPQLVKVAGRGLVCGCWTPRTGCVFGEPGSAVVDSSTGHGCFNLHHHS
ncbi:hypothetical protein BMF90_05845 [Serratia sp. OLHL2]|nr:hypothetical protein BMF87_03740 [Serratia sp. OLEL1]PII59986.1 hypothetical protein BMF85_09230 [Serratia sp. OLCL1]PII61193.1 hypothetical protein BMF92_13425 [Serratia sp. OLBL1]PII66334.1 hypothetical protein BMF90_05845 [Serratia sp. OLHL2]PII76921.1 hypothetical protein BMH23_05035 [Serratia sp. OLIL2]PII79074.1 hypothetical protein BMF88_04530 [Serratia sp. OLDL1]PII81078.1 hypothetical protein BMH24_08830 [Serratia sp. OLJL1]PII86697.1 hypothetical protein BMF91_21690 [Serratia sp